jgi:hypothetical protein
MADPLKTSNVTLTMDAVAHIRIDLLCLTEGGVTVCLNQIPLSHVQHGTEVTQRIKEILDQHLTPTTTQTTGNKNNDAKRTE